MPMSDSTTTHLLNHHVLGRLFSLMSKIYDISRSDQWQSKFPKMHALALSILLMTTQLATSLKPNVEWIVTFCLLSTFHGCFAYPQGTQARGKKCQVREEGRRKTRDP